jgi:voltage-gated potassium channel
MSNASTANNWRERVHEIIFEADTPAGKAFDIALLITILISVAVISLESVQEFRLKWGAELTTVSRVITVLFTMEYVLRLMCVRRPWKYALSFFGIVDLLAILPGLLSFFVDGPEYMSMIRSLRLLRVFHIFQMGPYVTESRNLIAAVRATKAKIIVFLFSLMTIVLILGTAIYIVENPDPQNPDPSNQFTSIPRSVYWAIVTLTTVGYGDIAPQTVAGQVLAGFAMILGYSMIIVPVAIFSVEMLRGQHSQTTTQSCPSCIREGHEPDAVFCKYCGGKL